MRGTSIRNLALRKLTVASSLVVALFSSECARQAHADDPARLYVTDRSQLNMYVLDPVTLQTIGVVPVHGECGRPALNPTQTRVYVGCWGTNLVYEIDTTSLTVLRTFSLERNPADVVVTPDGLKLFVANRNSQSLSVVDLTTEEVTRISQLSDFTFWSLVMGTHGRAYASSWGTVYVIDTVNDVIIDQLPGPASPGGLALNPDEDRLYAADGGSGQMYVIDLVNGTTLAAIPGSSQHGDGIALSPDGNLAYMTHANTAGGVSVFDTPSLTLAGRYTPDGIFAGGIALDHGGSCLYVRAQSHLSVLRASDGQVFVARADLPANGSVVVSSGQVECGQQSDAEITWSPAGLPYGQPLGAAQLNAAANVPGTFTYTPAAGAILPAGTHELSVLFTPSDPSRYRSVTRQAMVTIDKAVPVLSWSAPAPIAAGTPLGNTQLNATSETAGTFTYSPPAGTVLPIGTHQLSAIFSSTNANYLDGAIHVSLTMTHRLCALYDASRPVKAGSTLPIKVTLCDAEGTNQSSATIPIVAEAITLTSGAVAGELQDAGQSNADANFRYAADFNGYIFNLQTTGLNTGTYALRVRVGAEPGIHFLAFQVK
jgi:DNA-binding beta-propeller fold protein YncE